ncbi:Biopolymer transport protein ExbD [Azoarcus sp. Aa7]|nr:Biopolymer transport protein ExbD [Azoarcus sp. Aa7]
MRQRRLMNQINVVPYIDVMLVLLVIFMVTAPMIQTGSVDLPTVGGVPQPPVEAMILTVSKDGSLALQATAASPPRKLEKLALIRELESAVKKNPSQPIIVAADKNVIYDEVMKTLQDLRTRGFQKISLQTQNR